MVIETFMLIMIILILTLSIILMVAYYDKKLAKVLLIALILRIGVVIVHHYIVPLPDSHADARMFQRVAETYAENGFSYWIADFKTGAFLYPWILGFFYLIGGPNEWIAQYLNILLGVLDVLLIIKITALLVSEKKHVFYAGLIGALYPTLILYSAVIMRENFIITFILLGIYYVLKGMLTKKSINFMLAAFFYVITGHFHTGMFIGVISLLIYFTLTLAYNFYRRFIINWKYTLFLFVVFLIFIIVVINNWGLEKIWLLDLGNLTKYHEYVTDARAGYLQNLKIANIFDLLWQLPIRVIYFLGTPFPWMIRNIGDFFGFFDGIAVLYFFITILKNYKYVCSKELKYMLFLLILGVLIFSIPTSNYGQAIRHRAKFVPLLIIVYKEICYYKKQFQS